MPVCSNTILAKCFSVFPVAICTWKDCDAIIPTQQLLLFRFGRTYFNLPQSPAACWAPDQWESRICTLKLLHTSTMSDSFSSSYISVHCSNISNMHLWLTSPSQLLIATEASGMSLTSPMKTQSLWICSLVFSTKSSCHSTKAPGATSLLLALRRRCSSFPNTVTLKNKCWAEAEVTEGISGALRATLLLLPKVEPASPSAPAGAVAAAAPLLPVPAETTWERYRPWESVLNGTIRPYSLNFPESFSDGTDSVKWESHSQLLQISIEKEWLQRTELNFNPHYPMKYLNTARMDGE